MDRAELLKRLAHCEWTDFEVKKAQHGVPADTFDTVSAFANTSGGHLVFGIAERDGRFEIVGVLDLEKVQNDFLSALRSREKVSVSLETEQSILDHDGKRLLAFYIPEAARRDKPVYLNKDLRLSYIRRGGADQKCNEAEIKRFLRDAGGQSFESELIECDVGRCFDPASVKSYRERFALRDAAAPCNALDDVRFLEHWGLVVEVSGRPVPTRAGLLLLGAGHALRAVLPRPIVSCSWHGTASDAPASNERWLDRIVCEGNLLQSWGALAERYAANASKPFALDMRTMERADRLEDYTAFREATINLLIHQDFAETGGAAAIAFYRDRVDFANPGSSFANASSLLSPGVKDVRNPLVVAAFRRIGLSEQAGSGIRAIVADWRSRGRVMPRIENDVASNSFRLSLLAEELMSEQQLLFQAGLGVRLSSSEAAALAILCRVPEAALPDLRAGLGLNGGDAQRVADRLVKDVLAEVIPGTVDVKYRLAPHLRERWPLVPREPGATQAASSTILVTDQPRTDPASLVTDQPQPSGGAQAVGAGGAAVASLDSLTDIQRRLLAACDTPRPMRELLSLSGVTHRAHFRKQHLDPLIKGGLLQLQFPDRPNHPRQRYALTSIAAQIVAKFTPAPKKDADVEAP